MGKRPSGWSANGGSNAMPVAPQYILQISNASNALVQNFDVFGAAQYLSGGYGGGTWSNNGNFTLNGVTISCLFGTVSYQQLLDSTRSQPLTSGGVYLQSITGSQAQITDPYTVNTTSPGGSQFAQPIKPFLDPKQFQSGITYNNQSFNVTALTKMTWANIYASAVFQLAIFPANIIDPSQALNAGAVQSNYGAPKVIGNLS